MTDLRATKQALRRQTVARILALEPAERHRQEALAFERFTALPGYASARTVLLYASAFPEEIQTRPILLHALASGQIVACPKVDWAEKRLRLYQVEDLEKDLAPARRGIPEPKQHCRELAPADIDWVLVPGLAFDRRRFRLGRGAGHYDRLLPTLRPDAGRWALALDCQWVDEVPVESHDVPLDGVVSPGESAARER